MEIQFDDPHPEWGGGEGFEQGENICHGLERVGKISTAEGKNDRKVTPKQDSGQWGKHAFRKQLTASIYWVLDSAWNCPEINSPESTAQFRLRVLLTEGSRGQRGYLTWTNLTWLVSGGMEPGAETWAHPTWWVLSAGQSDSLSPSPLKASGFILCWLKSTIGIWCGTLFSFLPPLGLEINLWGPTWLFPWP